MAIFLGPAICGHRASIDVPSPAVRSYLRSASIAAVCVLADGSITCVRDLGPLPQPAVAAWWTSAAVALRIVKACRAEESVDVPTIAASLQIGLTPHATAVARAARAVATARRHGRAAQGDRV